jgi:hypothetical protein
VIEEGQRERVNERGSEWGKHGRESDIVGKREREGEIHRE